MARSYGEMFRPILDAALEEEIGLYIETDNKLGLLNTLYEQMKTDPACAVLTILQPTIEDHPNVLFIAKKTTELVE